MHLFSLEGMNCIILLSSDLQYMFHQFDSGFAVTSRVATGFFWTWNIQHFSRRFPIYKPPRYFRDFRAETRAARAELRKDDFREMLSGHRQKAEVRIQCMAVRQSPGTRRIPQAAKVTDGL